MLGSIINLWFSDAAYENLLCIALIVLSTSSLACLE